MLRVPRILQLRTVGKTALLLAGVLITPKGPEQGFDPNSWYKFRVMFKGWCKGNRADLLTCTKRHSRAPFEDADAGVSFRGVKGCN